MADLQRKSRDGKITTINKRYATTATPLCLVQPPIGPVPVSFPEGRLSLGPCQFRDNHVVAVDDLVVGAVAEDAGDLLGFLAGNERDLLGGVVGQAASEEAQ
jgi:hypothetical protein